MLFIEFIYLHSKFTKFIYLHCNCSIHEFLVLPSLMSGKYRNVVKGLGSSLVNSFANINILNKLFISFGPQFPHMSNYSRTKVFLHLIICCNKCKGLQKVRFFLFINESNL